MDDLIRYLLENSVYVRDCRNFPGLENNFFRIGLRSPEDNDKLISILSSFPYA
jgi:threonine-phosphate decarboxylase